MPKTFLLLALLAAAVAWAGEAEKPKDEEKPKDTPVMPAPEGEEVDKPGKPGVRRPIPLPAQPAAEPADKEGGKPKPQHLNPFRKRGRKPTYAVPTRVTYSDGKVLEGWSWRRADGTLRVFNRKARAHQDYFLSDLVRIDVVPESKTFERDWRWKNQGSSEKVFLDVGYFWNQYVTTLHLTDDTRAAGDCSGQFYMLLMSGERTKWYLYKRHSGRDTEKKKREELEPLVYVKTVEFTDDFVKKAEEAAKKAEEAAAAEPKAPNP